MARGETHALYAPGLSVEVAAVGVHVLPEQRDFLHARCNIALGFGDYLVERTRFLASAHVGHDAVRAEVVAPNGDGQPSSP